MAIIPWHIHFSRMGREPASLFPFLLLSIYLFAYGANRNRKLLIASSFGLFSVTIYTYHAVTLYSFLFLATLIILNRRYFLKVWKVLLSSVVISTMILFPYVWTVISEPHEIYYRASRIFTFSNGVNTKSVGIFLSNYFNHFSPSFLFINGDPNLRHSAQTGTIYWAMLPFIIAGIIHLIITRIERRVGLFILF